MRKGREEEEEILNFFPTHTHTHTHTKIKIQKINEETGKRTIYLASIVMMLRQK